MRPGRREQTDLRTQLCLPSRSSSTTLTVSDGEYPAHPSPETRDPREALPAGGRGGGEEERLRATGVRGRIRGARVPPVSKPSG